MSKKIKRPEELDMEGYFGGDNSSSRYTRENGYRKVPDRPEIIFPASTYEPLPGATIKGLQNITSSSTGTGTIKIDTTPTGAEFFLVDDSGKETSFGLTTTAITITDIPIGTYNYVIRLSGYNDYSSNITVLEGQICCISVDLQASTEKQQCATQPVTPGGVPQSVPGYVVIPERTLTIVATILALAAGLVIGYFLLKKKE